MKFRELVTYSFPKNVGSADRVFRIASGASLAAAGWFTNASLSVTIALLVAGAGWAATGILSRCSLYYLVGYSSCPLQPRQTNV